MAALIVYLTVLFAMAGHSYGNYCVCKTGLDEKVLQTNIDYACGAGADCTPIKDKGPCFNPDTIQDHCNYAVNSYYQNKGQAQGSCDFKGSATVTSTAPTAGSGCVYPTGPSKSGTPSTNPSTNPSTGGTTTIPGSSGSPPFGLAPTGIFTNPDNTMSVAYLPQASNLFISLSLALLFSSLIC